MQALRERITSKLSEKSKSKDKDKDKEKDGSSIKSSHSADGKHTTLSDSHQASASASATNAQSADKGIFNFFDTKLREKPRYILVIDQDDI
jgi:hypothetical protein